MLLSTYLIPALVVVLLAIGIISVVSTRLLRAGWKRRFSFCLFMIWMSATGITTAQLASLGSEYWLPLGGMLSLLAVGATIDLGGKRMQSSF